MRVVHQVGEVALHLAFEIRVSGLDALHGRHVGGIGLPLVACTKLRPVEDIGLVLAVDLEFPGIGGQRVGNGIVHEVLVRNEAKIVALLALYLVDALFLELLQRDAPLLRLALHAHGVNIFLGYGKQGLIGHTVVADDRGARHDVVQLLLFGKRIHAGGVFPQRREDGALEFPVRARFVQGIAHFIVVVHNFAAALARLQDGLLLQVADDRNDDIAELDVQLRKDSAAHYTFDAALAQSSHRFHGIGVGAHGRPRAEIHEADVQVALLAGALGRIVANVSGEMVLLVENRIPHLCGAHHVVARLAEHLLRSDSQLFLGLVDSRAARQNKVARRIASAIEVVAAPALPRFAVMAAHGVDGDHELLQVLRSGMAHAAEGVERHDLVFLRQQCGELGDCLHRRAADLRGPLRCFRNAVVFPLDIAEEVLGARRIGRHRFGVESHGVLVEEVPVHDVAALFIQAQHLVGDG